MSSILCNRRARVSGRDSPEDFPKNVPVFSQSIVAVLESSDRDPAPLPSPFFVSVPKVALSLSLSLYARRKSCSYEFYSSGIIILFTLFPKRIVKTSSLLSSIFCFVFKPGTFSRSRCRNFLLSFKWKRFGGKKRSTSMPVKRKTFNGS